MQRRPPRLKFCQIQKRVLCDDTVRWHVYFRYRTFRRKLSGLPGSDEFVAAYNAALKECFDQQPPRSFVAGPASAEGYENMPNPPAPSR